MHMATAVVHNRGEDIDAILEYYTYDLEWVPDGVVEFTVIGDEEKAKIENEFKNKKYDKMSFDKFLDIEYNYKVNDDKNIGYYINPYGIYDWYEIGGRFKDSIVTQKGTLKTTAAISEIDWVASSMLLHIDNVSDCLFDYLIFSHKLSANTYVDNKKLIKDILLSGSRFLTIVDMHM
ncbi:MAG: hypothetical protein AUK24_09445 [Syntrophaceae bacterium CG2_30_49_12]|nr:MAG: hypothetical protein AUK24_09445 [Syntrophaceae bacterium CG2_30_49_12]